MAEFFLHRFFYTVFFYIVFCRSEPFRLTSSRKKKKKWEYKLIEGSILLAYCRYTHKKKKIL